MFDMYSFTNITVDTHNFLKSNTKPTNFIFEFHFFVDYSSI